ncbi:LPXTG cell wall anchor domain-containing protein [Streptococcus pluranimalium]|uniref:LPXTG cell wall anchor domain-containing protein n=1 Tax=Streptococcus pluranimalium TaxID=82348 RepID=UPI003F693C99
MNKKQLLYSTAAILTSAVLGTATVSADIIEVYENGVLVSSATTTAELASELQASTTENKIADGFLPASVESENGVLKLYFTKPEVQPVVAPLTVEVYENGTKMSEATAADETGLTALQTSTTENKIAEGFTPSEVVREGNVLKLHFTKPEVQPVVAPLTVEVYENGTKMSEATAADETGLTALQTSTTENKIAEGFTPSEVVREGNVLKLHFTKPQVQPVVAPLTVEVYENGTKMSEATAADETGLTALQTSTTENKIADGFTPSEVVREGNVLKLYFTKPQVQPVVAPLTVEVYENGTKMSEATAADETGLTALQTSTTENKIADGFTPSEVVREGNVLKLYFTKAVTNTIKEDEPVVDKLEDFKIIVKVDGEEVQTAKFEMISHLDFLQHLSALTEDKLAEGLAYEGNVQVDNVATLSFSTPAEADKPAVSEELENFKIIVKVDGKEVQVSDFEAITHLTFLNHLATLTEAKLAEGLAYDGNVQVYNVATLSFSTPAEADKPAVSEELENFKIIVKVDGKEVQVSDFEAITYSDFVNHLATLTEAKLAEDLTYVSTDFDGNTVTLSFETAAEADKPAVSEELENFKIIVKVDGKEVQVSDFEAITYSDFVNHLATLTEAKLAEDLTYVSTDFDGNTVTLSFSTPAEAEKPAVSKEPENPVKEDSEKEVVADKEETTDKKAEGRAKDPAVTLGNKKATAKKDAQYAKDATLPSTGDNSSATFAIAGLAIMGLGLAGVAKRKFNN